MHAYIFTHTHYRLDFPTAPQSSHETQWASAACPHDQNGVCGDSLDPPPRNPHLAPPQHLRVFMCEWKYIYTYMHIYTAKLEYVLLFVYIYMYTHAHTRVCIYVHILIHTHTHKCMYTRTHILIHAWWIAELCAAKQLCICIPTHTHVYIYANAHAYTHTHMHAHKHTNTHKYIHIPSCIHVRAAQIAEWRVASALWAGSAYVHTRKHSYLHFYIYIHTHTHTHTCIYTHACVFRYTHTHAHHTDRETAHRQCPMSQ